VPGVLLYVYHTNSAGIYPKRGDETANARRHGYLRGWVISDENGRFEVRTIRPGTYPNRSEPAHIHMTVKEPGRPEYWIDNILFEGDPLITQKIRARRTGRGGPAVVRARRDSSGDLVIHRDVILAAPGEAE
jgi:protocatechuate 3,4-dioxygenase beta subunit